jgi:DNA-binding protein H-NS
MTAPGSEIPTLESLDDAALQEVMRRAGELLHERERARQREAIEQARAILAAAGLSAQDMIGAARGRGASTRKATSSTGGKRARYANPADPSQIYEAGRGRAPNWFRDLKEKGELPAPLD